MHNIKIVLIQTTHPGNIGATARAMKTMGLSELVLVNPYTAFPSAEITARAASADSVLETAQVVETLAEAVADCGLVIGSSAEERGLPLERVDARECAVMALDYAADNKVALVFGTERSGMSNEELALCHKQIVIPTNSEYTSLNLSQAVQVICYEIHMAALQAGKATIEYRKPYDEFATAEEMQGFHEHLEQMLIDVKYLKPGVEKKLMPRLKRLFNRAHLEKNEINILRGIWNAAQNNRKKDKGDDDLS
tara:strand:+ start:10052 stop:10804 length:753 start_codon:yes stop_codon:yes gene_type:complete